MPDDSTEIRRQLLESARAVSRGEYTRRCIAFIDILGSADLIRSDKTPPPDLVAALEELASQRPNYTRFEALEPGDVDGRLVWENAWRVDYFSDCIAMSSPVQGFGLRWTLYFAARLARDLLLGGAMIRGGIAVGDVLHDGRKLLGPAVLEAIEIERDLAIYPRIVLSDEVARDAERDERAARYVRQDPSDGLRFVDFMSANAFLPPGSPHHVAADLSIWRDVLLRARKEVEELNTSLESGSGHGAAKKRAKRRWLLSYMDVAAKSELGVTIHPPSAGTSVGR
jgi:hypothetical protein